MLRHAASMLPFALRASFAKKSLVSRVQRRVRPSECDFNLHMNQAAYAHVAELARMDWFMRAGLLPRLLRAGIKPVMAEQRIVYRRELKPGQRYAIDTRATAIDGRLLDIHAHLIVADRVHAVVYGKVITIGPDGVLAPEDAEALLGEYVTEPLGVRDWRVV